MHLQTVSCQRFSLFPLSANCLSSTFFIVSHCPGNVGHHELFSQNVNGLMSTRLMVIYRTMRSNHLFVTDLFRLTCVTLLSLASPGKVKAFKALLCFGTFGEVRNAGNPHQSQFLIFDTAGFPRAGEGGCVPPRCCASFR